jgi:hypothetical protein
MISEADVKTGEQEKASLDLKVHNECLVRELKENIARQTEGFRPETLIAALSQLVQDLAAKKEKEDDVDFKIRDEAIDRLLDAVDPLPTKRLLYETAEFRRACSIDRTGSEADGAEGLTPQGQGQQSQGAEGRDEQTEAKIPAYILKMLEGLPDESLVAVYTLITMGSKADEVWNGIIAWLDEKIEPYRQGDFGDMDMELEVVRIREWLAFDAALDICDDN